MAVRIESAAEPIPGYRLIERLGGGGFGEVWKAEAPGGMQKAIKFVFGDLTALGENGHRAAQELKALSRVKTVRHPYILSLERYDIIDGQLIIVMELADRNLWDRFKECRAQGLPGIPRDELLLYMEECAEALDLMNSEFQLQHLDIKPQNLFLVYQHVKVADFGLVKDLEGMQASVTGGVTPVYAAPETFDGWVSRFCDQYSLAICYQELLTGQRPFNGSNVRQLILQHLQSAPNLDPLPPGDRPIVGRALSKTPDERFPTCRELVQLLRLASPGVGPPTLHGAAAPVAPSALRAPARARAPGEDGENDDQPTASFRLRPASDAPPGTPRNTTEFLSAMEAAVLHEPACAKPKAPPEVHGDGVLLPALVVGLGQLGLRVLQGLREQLVDRFGSLEAVPHLGTLLLDTDPEAQRQAAQSPRGGLGPGDVLIAPLNRPSYYLKAREGRPSTNAWLNPRMLYRIPRSHATTGVRALGRLAFCDNYRAIVRRLQAKLTAVLDPDALERAVRQTKLGLRTNRPRVYVVTGLAGGTGGGIFLDVAYTLRALLRQAGYEQPDVVCVLLAPSAGGKRTRTMALGNACAALTELVHFAKPGSCFTARYHDREAAIEDRDPPFGRVVVLPLPEETDPVASRELVELTGHYLARDLTTPLGRACDLARAGQSAPSWEARGLYYQTFGMFHISCPRQAVERAAARQLCLRLVQRWMTKDGKPIREAVRAWVSDHWAQRQLGADAFIVRLREAAQELLGRPPEEALEALVEPLAAHTTAATAGPTARRPALAFEIAAEEIAATLSQFEELIGKPSDDLNAENPGTLVRLLRQAAERLTDEWAQQLADMPAQLIEEPAFRLAGGEEAIQNAVAAIEQVLLHHEPLAKDLEKQADEAFARLAALAVPPRASARKAAPPSAGDVLALLRCYPKWRFQGLLLQVVSASFVSLRGHLSDQLREVNFCRVRLTELHHRLEAQSAEAVEAATGRRLYPAGCKDRDEAVERLLKDLPAEAIHDLEARLQATIRERFESLVNVCLTSANVLTDVEETLLETARDFVAGHLPDTTATAIFLEQNADAEAAVDEMSNCFAEATPELAAGRSRGAEICVLAAPPGSSGDRLRELARAALPETELHPAPSADDIVIYREASHLPLAELEQLGPPGQEAYRKMSAAENFTPHSRGDIDFGPPRG